MTYYCHNNLCTNLDSVPQETFAADIFENNLVKYTQSE